MASVDAAVVAEVSTMLAATPFRVQHRLGEGAYGQVLLALDERERRSVALKYAVVDRFGPGVEAALCREVALLSELRHPNIVRLFDVVTVLPERGMLHVCLVMEWMEHGDLRKLLASHRQLGSSLPVAASKCILRQLATALAYCHARGVLHRDVKPANVLLSRHGEVKLADFGLARAVPPGQAHVTPRHVVTAGYRAPEVLLGDQRYGSGVDTWALGCIAYELKGNGPLIQVSSQTPSDHSLLERVLRLFGEPGNFLRALPGCCPGKACLEPPGRYSNSTMGTLLGQAGITRQLADLISALLKMNPAERMSAADVLQHPWLSPESKPPPCEPGALPGCSPAPSGSALPKSKMTPPLYTMRDLARAQPDVQAAAALRSSYCDHISAVCRYLGRHGQLPPTAYATAVIFTHRFFAEQPPRDVHNALLMADAAVLLAAKVLCSQCPAARMLARVVHASHHLRSGVLVATLTPQHSEPPNHEELQSQVLYAESCLAHQLHLRLRVPHAAELLCLAEPRLRAAGPGWGLPASLDVAALVRDASQLSDDALRTQLHIVVPPAVMAAACLLLAARELPGGKAVHDALVQPGRLAKLLRGLSGAAELTERQVADAHALERQLRGQVAAVAAAAEHARTIPLGLLMPAHSPCAPGPEPQWSLEFGAYCAQRGGTPPGEAPAAPGGHRHDHHHARAPAEAHAGRRRPRDDGDDTAAREGDGEPRKRRSSGYR